MSAQKTQEYWDILKKLSHDAFEKNEVPVAALLVHKGEVVSASHNLVETQQDPTLHAEMIVLKGGVQKIGKYLNDCELYVTLEPCSMCAHAIKLSNIKKVFFGAYDPEHGSIEHGERTFSRLPGITVLGGFHEAYFSNLLKAFFQLKR